MAPVSIARFATIFLLVVLATPDGQSAEIAGPQIVAAPWKEPPRNDPPADPTMERYPGTIEIVTGVPEAQGSQKEGAQVLVGQNYTILTPLFFGNGNNFSFFRFPNASLSTATFTATLVGSPSAKNYGSVIVTVAPYASPQYSISDIFGTLGISGPDAGDEYLSLYIQSPQAGTGVGFQHVVWNSLTGFFENASVCTYQPDLDYTILNRALVNIHTSNIPAYPSVIFLHNYASFPISYQVDVFKAHNGAYIGTVYFNLGANDIGSEYFSATEQTLNYSPAPGEYHVNMAFTALGVSSYYGLAAQAIVNLQLQSLTNMSVACGINP